MKCASGIPYRTSDFGGYHFHWQAPDWSAPINRELFTRWFQFWVNAKNGTGIAPAKQAEVVHYTGKVTLVKISP